jgi:flagellar biosynthesis protein FlhA
MSKNVPSTVSAENKNDLLSFILGLAKRGDIIFALGIIAILAVIVAPLPRWLMDIALALSLTLSFLILMTALFIEKPLDFSSFPTVLLLATMLRLALNIASTRLTLTDGHLGPFAAGAVIEAFGSFFVGGNFVIGIIIFAILIIINFVVITKGSGRIAEVSARFSLDAMPGKQMAIDADLSAGLIDEQSARQRRKELEEESAFYGAMDGAAKFVRGDAIAGLLITFIDIVGGIIIGVAQKGITFQEASKTYTLLTVGDGLVTQIPALIVSTAAGLLVSKGSTRGSADKALVSQLTNYPTALGLSSFLLVGLALIPGVPMPPFLILAGLTGWASYGMLRKKQRELVELPAEADMEKGEEPISTALHIDAIRLELGYSLLQLVNQDQPEGKLIDQVKLLRRQVATELGVILPPIRIQDNVHLGNNEYIIYIKDIEASRAEVKPDMYLVMDPKGDPIALPGETIIEPTFGLPAMWTDLSYKEEALFLGYTVVNCGTVIVTHLTECIKEHLSDILSYSETQKLLNDLPPEQQKLVADIIPTQTNLSTVQRVLQNLLKERISIRDIINILEGVAEVAPLTKNPMIITEHVRARLARQLCHNYTVQEGYIPVASLSPDWEQRFAGALMGPEDDKHLALSPSDLQSFVGAVRENYEKFASMGESPVLLTSSQVRPYVRSIIERFRPLTPVLSQNEIHSKARIKTIGFI